MAKSYNCICLGEISEKTSRFFERYQINSQRWFLFSLPDAWREDGEPFGSLVSIIKLTIWYNFWVPARVQKEKIKKENIYIIGTGLCQERINFFLFSLIPGKTMYTRKKREKHTATRQQLWRKIIDGRKQAGFLFLVFFFIQRELHLVVFGATFSFIFSSVSV